MTAWLWNKFGEGFLKTVAGGVWQGVQWAEAASRYRQTLYAQYKHIQIFGQAEPVPLEGIFTHVRVLDKPSALHRYDLRQLQATTNGDTREVYDLLREKNRKRSQALDGLALVQQPDQQRLLILGKPGAGKTTFLKYLTLQATKPQPRLDRLPILLTLREWDQVGGYDALMAFIAQQFEACAFPKPQPVIEGLLRYSNVALVLFDGLDEIPCADAQRDKAIAAIRDFSRRYPQAQVIVTCRVAAEDYTFQGFNYLEIADFNAGQTHAFVRKWFQAEPDTAEEFWEDFNAPENAGLRELGQTPLLLTLLCLAYDETLAFPQRRADLYTEALDALIKKWDRSRKIRRDVIYKHLPPQRKHQLFARLAAQAFEEGQYVFPQHVLEARIAAYLEHLPAAKDAPPPEGEIVLRAIEAQHGIFVERARDLHTFAHLTFQEYYTARYVVDSVASGDADAIRRLLAHAREDRWQEVIRITVSLLDNADTFFNHFLDALAALVEPHRQIVEFLTWAARKAGGVDAPYRPAAIRSFYISFALDRDHVRDFACALDRAHDFVRVRERERARALNRARAFELALARARDFELARARDFDLDQALARVRAFDLHLDQALARARELSQALNLPALSTALAALTLPTADDPIEAWATFAAELHALMIEHRDIGHDWEFTLEQAQALERYFYAAELLVDCLDVAYVTDREAILDRLLLPPDSTG